MTSVVSFREMMRPGLSQPLLAVFLITPTLAFGNAPLALFMMAGGLVFLVFGTSSCFFFSFFSFCFSKDRWRNHVILHTGKTDKLHYNV